MSLYNIDAVEAYLDFETQFSTAEICKLLSEKCFGGIPFVDDTEGAWDEIDAYTLKQDVLGLKVVLGVAEKPESDIRVCSLEIGSWIELLSDVDDSNSVDLTSYLQRIISGISGFRLIGSKDSM